MHSPQLGPTLDSIRRSCKKKTKHPQPEQQLLSSFLIKKNKIELIQKKNNKPDVNFLHSTAKVGD